MRPIFSDEKRLRELAESNLNEGLVMLKQWWCKQYKLPPNDPRFLDQSIAELILERSEDQLYRRLVILAEIDHLEREEGSTGNLEGLYDELNGLNKILGYPVEVQDDLVDQWERDLAEGRMPDLDAMPAGA